MIDRERLQRPPAPGRDLEQDTPAIGPSLPSLDEARTLASITEFDNGIVMQPQTLREITDRRRSSARRSSDLQEKLMLLGLETESLRSRLTEDEKPADLVAEFGEYLKPGCRCSLSRHCNSSIS